MDKGSKYINGLGIEKSSSDILYNYLRAPFDYDTMSLTVKHRVIWSIVVVLDMSPKRRWVFVVFSHAICKDWLHGYFLAHKSSNKSENS